MNPTTPSDPATPERPGDLLSKTVRSSSWAAVGQQAVGVFSLVTSIAVAHALAPSELGQYALVVAINSIVSTVSTVQAGGYYIIAADPSRRLLRTGITLEFTLGAVLCLLTGIACVGVGTSTGEWKIPGLLMVGSMAMLLAPFNTVRAWFERRLQYRTPTLALAGSAALSSVAKIVLTAVGFGAWGLVIGDLVFTAAYSIAMLVAIPDARGFAFDRALARKQLAFGLPAMANGTLNVAASRVPDLTIGAFLGTHSLGYYFLASRIPAQISQLGLSFGNTLFPAFSRSNSRQLQRGITAAMRFSATLTFIPLAVVIPLGEPIVSAVWGSVWTPAAVPLAVLLAWVSVRLILWPTGNLLKSQNRMRDLVRLGVWQLVLTPVCVVAGTALWGLYGAVGGMLAVELLLVPLHVRLIRSIVPLGVWETVGPASVAGVIALLVATAASALLPEVIAVATATLATLVIFAWVTWLTDRPLLGRMVRAFRKEAQVVAT